MAAHKFSSLLLLLVILATIVLLATSLSGTRLPANSPRPAPGQAVGASSTKSPSEEGEAAPARLEVSSLKTALIVGSVLLGVVYVLWHGEARRGLLRDGLIVSVSTFTLIVGLARLRQLLGGSPGAWLGSNGTAAGEIPAINASAILWLSLLLAAAILALGISLGRRWLTRRTGLETLALAPRAALADLEAGEELHSVIMRCYAEMTRAVSRQRGLQLQAGLTAREFELRLTEAGLPAQSVQRLTRLFERVRYGRQATGAREEMEARDCLAAIVAACEGQP